MANIRPTIVDPSKFKVETYTDLSARDARRKIKRLLDQTQLMISPERVASDTAGRQTDGNVSGRVPGKAIVEGVTYVNCSNDNSENNYRVEYGKPVCFDMVTGLGATGINPAWSPDEYKVLGTALGDVSTGTSRIPVLLGVMPTDHFSIVAKCTPDTENEGEHPKLEDWSKAEEVTDQVAVWDFELPKECSFNEDENDGDGTWEGSGIFVRVCNLTRQYIYKEMFVLLHSSGKPKLQFYCEFYMCPTIFATLSEDLTESEGKAEADINAEVAGGIEGTKVTVYDRMLESGMKLEEGAKVYATLLRTSDSGEDGSFVWKFFVNQANKCPKKDTSSSE